MNAGVLQCRFLAPSPRPALFPHIHHIPRRGVPFSGTPPFFLSRFSSRCVGHDELEFRPALVIVIHEDFEAAAQVFAGMLLELPAQFGGQAFGAVAAHDREGVGVLGDVVGQDVAGFELGRRLLPKMCRSIIS